MRGFLLCLFIAVCTGTAYSQEMTNKSLEVGMLVRINKCSPNAKSFEGMDLYTKTRYPDSGVKIDSVTGDGIYESFFAPGDFDAKRLPCSYGNKKYKIAALRVFEKEGKEQRVMICYTGNRLSMIWIELDKALELKEIEF